MLIYFFLFFGLVFLCLKNTSPNIIGLHNKYYFDWLITFFVILLFIGSRFKVGGDWWAYKAYFTQVSDYTSFIEGFKFDILYLKRDVGYFLINWLARDVGGIFLINFICALIFTYSLFTFSKFMPNPWIALITAFPYFIVVVSIGYVRQSVAIALIMLGLTYIFREKFIKFIFITILAATFHKSAAFFIILLFLFKNFYTKINLFAFILVLCLFYYYVFASNLYDNQIKAMVFNYLLYSYNSDGAFIRIVMSLLPSIIFLLYQKRFLLSYNAERIWFFYSILSIFLFSLFFIMPSNAGIDRFMLYVTPLVIFFYSAAPSVFSKKNQVDFLIVFLIILYNFLILYVWLNYGKHSFAWKPYDSYFFKFLN